MLAMILQAIQVLVSLPADFTPVRLLLLHANSTGIRNTSCRVDNGESAVGVLFQLLVLMAVLLVVFEAILVLVRLFTTDDRAFEGFDLFANEATCARKAIKELLLAETLGKLTIVGVGAGIGLGVAKA